MTNRAKRHDLISLYLAFRAVVKANDELEQAKAEVDERSTFLSDYEIMATANLAEKPHGIKEFKEWMDELYPLEASV